MFPTVFKNNNYTCKKEENNQKLITLGNIVLNNARYGLNRPINYLDYIKILYLN